MTKCQKKEYEELFNKVFGVQVKWSKLGCDELVQIATVLANPGDLIRKLKNMSSDNRTREEKLLEGIKLVVEGLDRRGPVISMLKRLLVGEDVQEGKDSVS